MTGAENIIRYMILRKRNVFKDLLGYKEFLYAMIPRMEF